MDYKGRKVLLLDGYGRQIPSLMKQLHQLGCKITTISDSKLDVGYTSRYPTKKIVAKGIRENQQLYREVIERELAAEHYDVLFPVLEKATDICIDGTIAEKYPDMKILAAPREAFLKAYDKQQTMTVCMENQIPCPITKLDSETLDEYLKKVQFPLAAKPRKGSGGAGFKKVLSAEHLEQLMTEGLVLEEYVLQEYVPQTEHMFNCYVMMDENHESVFTVTVETCRWFPVDGGPGCFARTVKQPVVTDSAVRLLHNLKWVGFGQVSFMFDPRDKTPKVTEINGRISAGIKICDYAGCTPVKFMLDRAYGQKLVPVGRETPEGLCLRYFHTDIMWLLKSPNRFKCEPSWFNFRKNRDYIFSWKDPIPFFSYAIEHVLAYRKDMAKRKH